MKKVMYGLILPLVVVGRLVFANSELKSENPKNPTPIPISAADKAAAMKAWYTTPGGIAYKNWKASPEGKKVLTGAAKISKNISDFTNMEAVITSLSLPSGSRLGFGMMARINGEDYIISFGVENSDRNFFDFTNEFEQLRSLKVNDKIIIRSHNVSHAPKYSYPIISGDYVERDRKILYKRPPRKGGC